MFVSVTDTESGLRSLGVSRADLNEPAYEQTYSDGKDSRLLYYLFCHIKQIELEQLLLGISKFPS